MYRVFIKLAVGSAILSLSSISAKAVEVYMFKGAGDFSFVNENMHFSRGLNEMSDILNKEGIRSEVRRFGQIEDALAAIRERKPKSVAFVGHSMGALASMAMARNLKDEGVNIAYMALIDIPGPVGVAGENVNWVENYFSINPVYGRLTNTKTHPNAKNIHVAGYIHNRMDDAPKVQNGILDAIRQVHAKEMDEETTPANPDLLMAHQRVLDDYSGSASVAATNQIGSISQSPYKPAAGNQQLANPSGTAIPNDMQFDPSLSVTYVDPQGNQHPYPLPSVRSQDSVGANGQYPNTVQQVPVDRQVDQLTTSSVEKPGLVARGKHLLRRAGNYIQRNVPQHQNSTPRTQPDR